MMFLVNEHLAILTLYTYLELLEDSLPSPERGCVQGGGEGENMSILGWWCAAGL